MLTRKFWTGREFFVVVDDATVWPTADNPLARLAPYVEQADSLGLHLIAAADIRNWSFQATGSSVLGRVVGSLPPVLILDGRRDNGPIISGVYAEPQRPGKAIYATASGSDGVLIGWTPPPKCAWVVVISAKCQCCMGIDGYPQWRNSAGTNGRSASQPSDVDDYRGASTSPVAVR